MRPIDADALIEKACWVKVRMGLFDVCDKRAVVTEVIEVAPTLNPDDCRPQGRWIEHKCEWFLYKCSFCRQGSDFESPYCPNCGAKMDGKENNT